MSSNVAATSCDTQDRIGTSPHRSPQAHARHHLQASGSPSTTPANGSDDVEEEDGSRRSKRRRKVNHACVYCRRSHMTCDQKRPCSRCVKRDIGHLCHDEPRELKRQCSKTEGGTSLPEAIDHELRPDPGLVRADSSRAEAEPSMRQASSDESYVPVERLVESNAIDSIQQQNFTNAYNAVDFSNQLQFQDIHNFHSNYMFNTSEVSNEFNFLNDFLNTSLLDDGALFDGDLQGILSDTVIPPQRPPGEADSMGQDTSARGIQLNRRGDDSAPSVTGPKGLTDKAREKYYMTAADPAGTDAPEERMGKLLKAKYDAGLLKPFNYVKGYARLNQYMDRNLHSNQRQRILRMLDRFRPKFRERMQRLTDIELVMVEMWFERKLMEYDRVFASMAIPACCWRRTGEIFRGNREMAELIHVPVEHLRDGKLSIHEIFVEDSLVSYWEKFGAIAFETSQKAILTSCILKNPKKDVKEKEKEKMAEGEIRCCFSFTIQRDTHSIPSLIIGNFLPIRPSHDPI